MSSSPIDYTLKDLDKVLQYDGTIKNVKTSRLTAPGENFTSLVLRVEFDVEKKNGEVEKKDIVAKRIPLGEQPFIAMNLHSMKNEILWYTKIKPILVDFSQQYGIDCSHIYPEYYGSRLSLDPTKETVDRDALLLIENLNPKGYRTDDRLIGSDFLTCKTVLKDLALFHAIPLAMKFNQPEKFKIIKDYIKGFQPDLSQFAQAGPPPIFDFAKPLLKAIADIPELAPHMDKLEPVLSVSAIEHIFMRTEDAEPWSTIAHFDFWVNNILIKPGKEGSAPSVKFVDFQVCAYKSVVYDVILFLLVTASNEVQKTRMDDLLKIYYEEFIALLQKFKVDQKQSYEEYLAEIGDALRKGELSRIVLFCLICLIEKNPAIDVALGDVNPMFLLGQMIPNLNEQQKERLTVVLTQVIKRNWV